MIYLVALVVGLLAAGVNVWQRLGRSNAARGWARGMTRSLAERRVLVLWPTFAIAMLAAGGLGLADGSAFATLCGLVMIVALLVFIAYAVLPLPVPRFAMPRWYAAERANRARSARA